MSAAQRKEREMRKETNTDDTLEIVIEGNKVSLVVVTDCDKGRAEWLFRMQQISDDDVIPVRVKMRPWAADQRDDVIPVRVKMRPWAADPPPWSESLQAWADSPSPIPLVDGGGDTGGDDTGGDDTGGDDTEPHPKVTLRDVLDTLAADAALGWLDSSAIYDHCLGEGWDPGEVAARVAKSWVTMGLEEKVAEGKWSRAVNGRKRIFRPGKNRKPPRKAPQE